MKIINVLPVLMLLSTAEVSYSADLIDSMEQRLDIIEELVQTNPEKAQKELKDFQSEYGANLEFGIFMDRYDTLKSSLYPNNNLIEHTGETQNVVTNIPLPVQEVVMDLTSLANVLPEIKAGTLVLLDIDDTLMARSWKTQQHVLLEQNLSEIINNMRNQGARVIAFTHRSMDSDAQQRLQGLGINLQNDSIAGLTNDDVSHDPGYSNGILYAATRAKGDVLTQFITKYEEIYGRPTQILFVDDSEDNVRDVCNATEYLNINSKCFHYTGGIHFLQQQHDFMGDREFGIAPTREEEDEMKRYGINSVEELRSRKQEAAQLGMPLGDYLSIL